MEVKFDKNFDQKINKMFGKYTLQVGILNDSDHKEPLQKNGLFQYGSYGGGPVRKTSSKNTGVTISEVSRENSKRLGFNYLTEPFKDRSSDIIKFSNEFFKYVFGRSERKRLENLLQAIVRNPILRGEYGPSSSKTTKAKGFSRDMIDTGQLFKALKSKVTSGG